MSRQARERGHHGRVVPTGTMHEHNANGIQFGSPERAPSWAIKRLTGDTSATAQYPSWFDINWSPALVPSPAAPSR